MSFVLTLLGAILLYVVAKFIYDTFLTNNTKKFIVEEAIRNPEMVAAIERKELNRKPRTKPPAIPDIPITKSFKGFIELMNGKKDYIFYKADSKGLHYKNDSGYYYNEFAEDNLHAGFYYTSIYLRNDDSYKLKVYRVMKYEMADVVTHGCFVDVKPNRQKESYQTAFDESNSELQSNIDAGISQTHPKH